MWRVAGRQRIRKIMGQPRYQALRKVDDKCISNVELAIIDECGLAIDIGNHRVAVGLMQANLIGEAADQHLEEAALEVLKVESRVLKLKI